MAVDVGGCVVVDVGTDVWVWVGCEVFVGITVTVPLGGVFTSVGLDGTPVPGGVGEGTAPSAIPD